MEIQRLNMDARFSSEHVHRLRFTRNVFTPLAGHNGHRRGGVLRELLAPFDTQPARLLVFLDQAVATAWPTLEQDIQGWTRENAHEVTLAGPIHRVPGGECAKNDRQLLDQACQAVHDARLCRQSYVLVIGGGAVLDMVGFAAAICHRGVRLIRMPTTTLSQCDSGIGVKNGVNAFNRKNYLGTFTVPWAVVNDEALLATLSDRDWRCGFVEAVKVGLVKDSGLFQQIARDASRISQRDETSAIPVLRRSAKLHLDHIVTGGDPFELTQARPLDFGHWAGHKLEQMSRYTLRHGEAVAIGIAIDTLYASRIGMLPSNDAQAVLHCLGDLGFTLHHESLKDPPTLLHGLDEFREHLGGRLMITLLRGLGKGVDVHEIDASTMRQAIRQLAQTQGTDPPAQSYAANPHTQTSKKQPNRA